MNRKFHLLVVAGVLVGATCARAQTASTGPTVSIFGDALVMTLKETQGYPCGKPMHPPKHDFWGLRPGKSQFKLEKQDPLVNRIKRLNPVTEHPEMEQPAFFVYNLKKGPLTIPACENTQSFRNYTFAFAIHDLVDSHDPTKKGPHALVLLPTWIDKPAPNYKKEQFYMLVASIVDDARACSSAPSPALKEGCLALRELADMLGNASDAELYLAIWDRIDKIRPAMDHNLPPHRFHNGIIHGNF